MTVIPIGELSHRLRLEAPSRTADGGGGANVIWTLVAEVWGAIRTASGSERLEADGLKGRVSHEIWIRHRDGVAPDMRFVEGARVFDIRAVLDQAGRRTFLRCAVEERVT
jgi:SPP1 family predicted phage head-tail adaptor